MQQKLLFLMIAILVLFAHPALSQERSLYSKIGLHAVKEIKTPDFTLAGLNVKTVQLSGLRGNVILLNFWATWCGPCRDEMPSMEALHQRYKEKDFVLLAISVDEGSPEPIRKFIQNNRYRFPVLLDPAGKTLDLFEIDKIPAAVLINKKGRIIARAIGPRDWSRPEVFLLIDQMLDDRPNRTLSSKE